MVATGGSWETEAGFESGEQRAQAEVGEDRTGVPGISMSLLPLPCLTLCAATASDSSGCAMRVTFQGLRHILLGLDTTRLGKRLCFSS